MRNLYQKHRKGRKRPSVDALVQGLEESAGLQSRQFVAVDALDECQTADGCREKFLSVMLLLQAKHGVNVQVTSRELPDITRRFNESTALEIRAREEDIAAYVDGRISMSGVPLLHTYREMIKMKIAMIANGMYVVHIKHHNASRHLTQELILNFHRFRLARLYYDMISMQKTPWQLRNALSPGHPKMARVQSLVHEGSLAT